MTSETTKTIRSLLYEKTKVLLTIFLNQRSTESNPQLSSPAPMAVLFHHYHYPCVYYERIHKYFKDFLSVNTLPGHIRLKVNAVEIPSYRPLGLYVKHGDNLEVIVSEELIEKPFKILKRNWKQSLCILNPQKGAYLLITINNIEKQLEYYNNYEHGKYHGLENEGKNIALRGFYEGEVVERIADLNGTVKDLVYVLWPGLFEDRQEFKPEYRDKVRFYTHGIDLNLKMASKDFFDNFDYNDGYWYIKLKIGE